jgi:hypothetical protein
MGPNRNPRWSKNGLSVQLRYRIYSMFIRIPSIFKLKELILYQSTLTMIHYWHMVNGA